MLFLLGVIGALALAATVVGFIMLAVMAGRRRWGGVRNAAIVLLAGIAVLVLQGFLTPVIRAH